MKARTKKLKNNLLGLAALFFERGAKLMDTTSSVLKGEKVLKIILESKSKIKGGEEDERS